MSSNDIVGGFNLRCNISARNKPPFVSSDVTGFRAGEYGNRNLTLAWTNSISLIVFLSLWAERL